MLGISPGGSQDTLPPGAGTPSYATGNFQTSKAALESQDQGTSFSTSAETHRDTLSICIGSRLSANCR